MYGNCKGIVIFDRIKKLKPYKNILILEGWIIFLPIYYLRALSRRDTISAERIC